MAEPQTRPAGIDGSTLPGPYGVGAYAAKLREYLRGRSRVQLFGEVWNLRVSRSKVYLELRDSDGALPCAMWRNDFEALGLADRHKGRRAQPRRAGHLRGANAFVERHQRAVGLAQPGCDRVRRPCGHLARGVDFGTTPVPRSVVVGFNVVF